ncbi:hypothetical protein AMATHDRAFT_72380 [Amanita thiersii Skay4041]|uniref:DUF6534 domain-containing protein n=1 Tax=Amanita thiersii Skay4041 TaxID=703135 RepID=A0A2A9P1K3_9AGAR|nr:hypothetical protein AMATHDRAFT_72380 [Amanita thiersii Skay4041]
MGEFDKTVGVLLIGIFFNTYLYGLVTYQFLVYGNTKFNDPLWIRLIVWTLFATDTTHSAVAIYAAYDTCVINYGKPESLLVVTWTIPFLAIATAFAALITQIFLSHRVYVFTKSKILVGLICSLGLTAFIFSIYAGTLAMIVKEVTHFDRLRPSVTMWLSLQVTVDMIITIILIYVLINSRTGLRRTDTVINRLIRGAVQTGLFAAIFALADLSTFIRHEGTNFYAMFAYPIGRIYTNTLMDTLNARAELRTIMDKTVDLGSDVNAIRMRTFESQGQSSTNIHSIQVDVNDSRSDIEGKSNWSNKDKGTGLV